MRDPKLHWHAWECPDYDRRDNFTILPGLITCRACATKLRKATAFKTPARSNAEYRSRRRVRVSAESESSRDAALGKLLNGLADSANRQAQSVSTETEE